MIAVRQFVSGDFAQCPQRFTASTLKRVELDSLLVDGDLAAVGYVEEIAGHAELI